MVDIPMTQNKRMLQTLYDEHMFEDELKPFVDRSHQIHAILTSDDSLEDKQKALRKYNRRPLNFDPAVCVDTPKGHQPLYRLFLKDPAGQMLLPLALEAGCGQEFLIDHPSRDDYYEQQMAHFKYDDFVALLKTDPSDKILKAWVQEFPTHIGTSKHPAPLDVCLRNDLPDLLLRLNRLGYAHEQMINTNMLIERMASPAFLDVWHAKHPKQIKDINIAQFYPGERNAQFDWAMNNGYTPPNDISTLKLVQMRTDVSFLDAWHSHFPEQLHARDVTNDVPVLRKNTAIDLLVTSRNVECLRWALRKGAKIADACDVPADYSDRIGITGNSDTQDYNTVLTLAQFGGITVKPGDQIRYMDLSCNGNTVTLHRDYGLIHAHETLTLNTDAVAELLQSGNLSFATTTSINEAYAIGRLGELLTPEIWQNNIATLYALSIDVPENVRHEIYAHMGTELVEFEQTQQGAAHTQVCGPFDLGKTVATTPNAQAKGGVRGS